MTLINSIEATLVAESHVNRCDTLKPILKSDQNAALKELKGNPNIVISKAEKSNNFVIFDTGDHKPKLDVFMSDSDKFIRVTKDPTTILQKKFNKLIDNINATSNNYGFRKLEGHSEPGYIYGTAKIHKNASNLTLWPIISHVTFPPHEEANKLNNVAMMIIAPNSRTRKEAKERGEMKGECGGI